MSEETEKLRAALQGLLAEPYGCPRCDSGKLRNPDRDHTPDCPYVIAYATLAATATTAEDEARAEFLDYVWMLVDYWHRETRKTDEREKLAGLAFSILSAIDGESAALPPYELRPQRDVNGERWEPGDVNIAGSLHEEFHGRDPRRRP